MKLCTFEDAGVAQLGPLALSRPAFLVRCGVLSLLDRQARVLGAPFQGALVRSEVLDLARLALPSLALNDPNWLTEAGPGGLLLVNARWLALEKIEVLPGPEVGLVGEQVAYVRVPDDALPDLRPHNLPWWLGHWKRTLPARPAPGVMIDFPWDLVQHNARALEVDSEWWAKERECRDLPAGVVLAGPRERLLLDPAARVEPLAFLDTTQGPVLLDAGSVVQAFSRVEGPCYVGPGTQILAGRVKGSSLGPQCRLGGEVEASIVQGFSNKAHDGFLGHSYLGEWVNFGAGTQTSDLRNDYGPVAMVLAGKKVDTGLMKVGSFVGDHTKTCIGTLLNTGSVIGPFNQLVTPGLLLPRYLPPFCQVNGGRLLERTDLRQMFLTAGRVMARRGREWGEVHSEFFLGLYERTAGERQQVLRDSELRRQRRAVV